jgi:hypothetical protein
VFKRRLIVLLSSVVATAGLLTAAGAANAFLRRRVTFANIVACLALFIALGGTSMAQSGARSAVRLITGQQVRDGSLTGADIRDGSLLAKDFRAGQLPSGQDGATGATGATGDQRHPHSHTPSPTCSGSRPRPSVLASAPTVATCEQIPIVL